MPGMISGSNGGSVRVRPGWSGSNPVMVSSKSCRYSGLPSGFIRNGRSWPGEVMSPMGTLVGLPFVPEHQRVALLDRHRGVLDRVAGDDRDPVAGGHGERDRARAVPG